MRWWPGFVVFVLYLAVTCLLLYWLDRQIIVVVSDDWRPFDLAAILLATATLVVTTVAVAIAILTVWGWDNIKKTAVKAAIKQAEQTALRATQSSLDLQGLGKDYSGAYEDANADE